MKHPDMSPSDRHLALLSELVQRIARTRRLSVDDRQDFEQSIRVKLLETNYAMFRRFEGHSSLRTYLTVVVSRLLKDWQNQAWGKWRPSAAARRLGGHAVRLERLVACDGLTTSEATAVVQQRPGAPAADVLLHIARKLPARARRQMVPESDLANLPGSGFEDPVAIDEQEQVEKQIRHVLRAALRKLPTDDRRLIDARYRCKMRFSTIAQTMGAESSTVYRRHERLMKTLRASLTAAGVKASDQIDPQAWARQKPALKSPPRHIAWSTEHR